MRLDNIVFPLFCLNRRPYSINYNIEDKTLEYKKYITSPPISFKYDKDLPLLPQVTRLWIMDNKSRFDYTCLKMEHVLSSIPKWGIDNEGKIFDFKKKYNYPASTRKIIRWHDDVIFLQGISYPFKIDPVYVSQIDFNTFFCQIVLIGGLWYIYKFVYSLERIEKVKI